MTARVWTIEELDRVHPLPDGWSWVGRGGGQWLAVRTGYDGDAGPGDWHIWVDECDTFCSMFYYYPRGASEPYDAPTDVALPVLLASKGLDSLGEMADALEGERVKAEQATCDAASVRFTIKANRHAGAAEAFAQSAAMLRRGTVKL